MALEWVRMKYTCFILKLIWMEPYIHNVLRVLSHCHVKKQCYTCCDLILFVGEFQVKVLTEKRQAIDKEKKKLKKKQKTQ